MAKMRIHKKKWNKKLTKCELAQAWFAMAKGNITLRPGYHESRGGWNYDD